MENTYRIYKNVFICNIFVIIACKSYYANVSLKPERVDE